MAQGNYDHPSYLTRQQIFLGRTVAGANGTSCQIGFPVSNMRIRTVGLNVVTAGTATDTVTFQAGTSSIGSLVMPNPAANTVVVSTDLNFTLAQGTNFNVKNGADATRVVSVVLEAYIDPASTWTGEN